MYSFVHAPALHPFVRFRNVYMITRAAYVKVETPAAPEVETPAAPEVETPTAPTSMSHSMFGSGRGMYSFECTRAYVSFTCSV